MGIVVGCENPRPRAAHHACCHHPSPRARILRRRVVCSRELLGMALFVWVPVEARGRPVYECRTAVVSSRCPLSALVLGIHRWSNVLHYLVSMHVPATRIGSVQRMRVMLTGPPLSPINVAMGVLGYLHAVPQPCASLLQTLGRVHGCCRAPHSPRSHTRPPSSRCTVCDEKATASLHQSNLSSSTQTRMNVNGGIEPFTAS